MKKLFARWVGKSSLSFNDHGVDVRSSEKKIKEVVDWKSVTKVVFVEYFEEYSGYFLTDEFKSKELYDDIFVDCCQNIVKVRTGGRSRINRNISAPFKRKFGTTGIYNIVFVEYCLENEEKTNLFAVHYKSKNKLNLKKELGKYLDKEKIFDNYRMEGFSYVRNI